MIINATAETFRLLDERIGGGNYTVTQLNAASEIVHAHADWRDAVETGRPARKLYDLYNKAEKKFAALRRAAVVENRKQNGGRLY